MIEIYDRSIDAEEEKEEEQEEEEEVESCLLLIANLSLPSIKQINTRKGRQMRF